MKVITQVQAGDGTHHNEELARDTAAPREVFDRFLERYGLVHCLFELARAIREENDKGGPGVPLESPELQARYVREYLANQIAGLAAFWRVHLHGRDGR